MSKPRPVLALMLILGGLLWMCWPNSRSQTQGLRLSKGNGTYEILKGDEILTCRGAG